MIAGRRKRLRERVRKWREMAVIARGYTGEEGTGEMRMWDESTLRSIMLNEELSEADRAEAVRAQIDAKHGVKVEKLERCDMATPNKFVKGIAEAVGKSSGGGVLWAVHRYLS